MNAYFAPTALQSSRIHPTTLQTAIWLLMLLAVGTVALAETLPGPVAFPGTLTVKTQTPTDGTLTGTSPDGVYIFQLGDTAPTKGSVTITDTGTGAYCYTPNDCASGTDTFDFTLMDSAGVTSASALVTVTINTLFPLVPHFPKAGSTPPYLSFALNANSSGNARAFINPGAVTAAVSVVTNDTNNYSVTVYQSSDSNYDDLLYPVGYTSFPQQGNSYADPCVQLSVNCPSHSYFTAVLYDSDSVEQDRQTADAYFVLLHMQYNMLNDAQQCNPGAFIGVGANQYLAGLNVHLEPLGFLNYFNVQVGASGTNVDLSSDACSTATTYLTNGTYTLPKSSAIDPDASGPTDWFFYPAGMHASSSEGDAGLKLLTDADGSFEQDIKFTVVQPHITVNNLSETGTSNKWTPPGTVMGIGAAHQQPVTVSLEPSDLKHGGLILQNQTCAVNLYDTDGATQLSPNDWMGEYIYDLAQIPPLSDPFCYARGYQPSMYLGGMLTVSYCPPDQSWQPWNSIGIGNLLNDHAFLTVVGIQSTLEYSFGGGNFQTGSGTIYVPEGDQITFKAIPTPDGLPFPDGVPTWSGMGDASNASGTGDTYTVTVAVGGKISADGGEGNSGDADFSSVGIGELDYSLDGYTFHSVPAGTLSVPDGTTVYFHVTPDPFDATFPDGSLTWSGAAIDYTQEYAVQTFYSSAGVCNVSVDCGNSNEQVNVQAVGVDDTLQYQFGNMTALADAPSTLYVPVGDEVTFQATPDPSTATFPDQQPTWDAASPTGTDQSMATLTLAYTGDTASVAAICGASSSSAVEAIAVGVEDPLQYQIGTSTDFANAPTTLYVPAGASVTFQANSTSRDSLGNLWPDQNPAWYLNGQEDTAAEGQDTYSSSTFSDNDSMYAECGTADTSTVTIKLIDHLDIAPDTAYLLAGGRDSTQITVHCKNAGGGDVAAAGIGMSFLATGGGKFSNGSSTYTTSTDGQGKAVATLYSTLGPSMNVGALGVSAALSYGSNTFLMTATSVTCYKIDTLAVTDGTQSAAWWPLGAANGGLSAIATLLPSTIPAADIVALPITWSNTVNSAPAAVQGAPDSTNHLWYDINSQHVGRSTLTVTATAASDSTITLSQSTVVTVEGIKKLRSSVDGVTYTDVTSMLYVPKLGKLNFLAMTDPASTQTPQIWPTNPAQPQWSMGTAVNRITPLGSDPSYATVDTFNASDTAIATCGTSTAIARVTVIDHLAITPVSSSLLADGVDTTRVTVQLKDAGDNAIATAGVAIVFSTPGGPQDGQFADPATPTLFATSCQVTTGGNGAATAILRSASTPSSTPGAEVISADVLYNGNHYIATATNVTFFTLNKLTVANSYQVGTAACWATGIGNANSSVTVSAVFSPTGLDTSTLTDMTCTWTNTALTGAMNTADNTQFFLGSDTAGSAVVTLYICHAVNADYTSAATTVVVLQVTGLNSASTALTQVDSLSYANFACQTGTGTVAVQALVTPTCPDVSAVYPRLLTWVCDSGSRGSTATCWQLSSANPGKTHVQVRCGASSATADVWAINLNLTVPPVVPVNDDTDNGGTQPDNQVSNDASGTGILAEDDLQSMTFSVGPNNLSGGSLAYAFDNSGSLKLCWNATKERGWIPVDQTWTLGGTPPPRLLWLEGQSVQNTAQVTMTYTWGNFTCTTSAFTTVKETHPRARIRIFASDKLKTWYGYGSEKYAPLGGFVYAVLELRLAAGEQVANSDAILSISDNYDRAHNRKLTGDSYDSLQLDVTVDEEFPDLDFTTTVNWYDVTGYPTTTNPFSATTSTPPDNATGSARILWFPMFWNTMKSPNYHVDDDDWFRPHMGHNGAHTLEIVEADGTAASEIKFTQADRTVVPSGPLPRQADVRNLVVTNVSTSNGTVDYFKYDPDPNGQYHRPKVSFTFEDEGDPTGDYDCYLLMQPTASNSMQTCGVASAEAWIAYNYSAPTTDSYEWDGKQNNLLDVTHLDESDWGTYTFDVGVIKYDFDSSEYDWFYYKWPYCLHLDSHTVSVDGYSESLGQSDDIKVQLRFSYQLGDYAVNNGYSNAQDPKANQLIIDDGLNERMPMNQGGNVVGTLYNGDGNGIVAYEEPFSGDSPLSLWRVIFLGEDSCWQNYRRDHQPSRMLVENKLPYGLTGPRTWEVLTSETYAYNYLPDFLNLTYNNSITEWHDLFTPWMRNPFCPAVPDGIKCFKINGQWYLGFLDNKMGSSTANIGCPNGFNPGGTWPKWQAKAYELIERIQDPVLKADLTQALENGNVVKILSNAGGQAGGITSGASQNCTFMDCAGNVAQVTNVSSRWYDAGTIGADFTINGLDETALNIAAQTSRLQVTAAGVSAIDADASLLGANAMQLGATAGGKVATVIGNRLSMCGSIAGKAVGWCVLGYYMYRYYNNYKLSKSPPKALTDTLLEITNDHLDIVDIATWTDDADLDQARQAAHDWKKRRDFKDTIARVKSIYAEWKLDWEMTP